jgi:hypothetical protein
MRKLATGMAWHTCQNCLPGLAAANGDTTCGVYSTAVWHQGGLDGFKFWSYYFFQIFFQKIA